jgi:hypothetical protein
VHKISLENLDFTALHMLWTRNHCSHSRFTQDDLALIPLQSQIQTQSIILVTVTENTETVPLGILVLYQFSFSFARLPLSYALPLLGRRTRHYARWFTATIEGSLFRVGYGLLWAFTLVRHPQIISYPFSTVCADVKTFCMKYVWWRCL